MRMVCVLVGLDGCEVRRCDPCALCARARASRVTLALLIGFFVFLNGKSRDYLQTKSLTTATKSDLDQDAVILISTHRESRSVPTWGSRGGDSRRRGS